MKNCTPMPPLSAQVIQSFWSFLPDRPTDGCWLWNGKVTGTGYGVIRHEGKYCGSHRISLLIATGVDPAPNPVLHTCDVKLCCNPSHLYVGDLFQNARDRVERGRTTAGHKRPGMHRKERLPEAEVLYMRLLHESGLLGMPEIAKVMGVHKCTVWDYISGRKKYIYPTPSPEI